MKNKGFSMVELIIVIAVMAVLAGLLAPVLIRYINKSRLSVDITTGREIASAIMSVAVDDEYKDDAAEFTSPHPVNDMQNDDFKKAVFKHLSVDTIQTKSKKYADGTPIKPQDQQFYYILDQGKNRVEVYYGGTGTDCQIYPKTGGKLLK